MLVFPNCKINLGLNITEKRSDGYHNIESVFYPINWCDALEVIENKNQSNDFSLEISGLKIEGSIKNNLIYKAFNLIKNKYPIPPIKVHLHKVLPMGAGLGGGSANAVYFINLINQKFELGINRDERLQMASELGSDCTFFIENKAVYATQKGNFFEPIKINLSQYYILIIYPSIMSNTKEAYDGIVPKPSHQNLKMLIENNGVEEWKNIIFNDFEFSIFKKYPNIKNLKDLFYSNGALYASLSGSGSSVFGIFKHSPSPALYQQHLYFLQKPQDSYL